MQTPKQITIDGVTIPLPVPPSHWGKDHYSTLAYVETRCVDSTDGIGIPKHVQIQTNHNRHPGMKNHVDGSEYGIRLKDGIELPGPDYDEWDCIQDFERYGLLENIGTGTNPAYRMLPLGNELCGKLRAHKTQGGNWGDFELNMKLREVR